MCRTKSEPVAAMMKRSGVIFDRDGVLNLDTGYVYKPEDLVWLDGAKELIVQLNRSEIVVVVATNQSGIGRGYFSPQALDQFHGQMLLELKAMGGWIDQFYHCPYHEDAVLPDYRIVNHPDRKPNPGMVLKAIADWNLDPQKSLMVGDRLSDVRAGEAAGVAGRLFDGTNLSDLVLSGLRDLGLDL
jgi:D-glycero-D-manno-heptose 1,7-bisphosphate phosphatase